MTDYSAQTLELPPCLTAEDVAALRLIVAERARQITDGGRTPAGDDAQIEALAAGAACYLLLAAPGYRRCNPASNWPFLGGFKSKDPQSDTVHGVEMAVASLAALMRADARIEQRRAIRREQEG